MVNLMGFRLPLASIVLFALLGACVSANAQTGAPSGYQIGVPPQGDFSGTGFESVQLNNGNLHIEVPLAETRGRGPSVACKYGYASLGWTYHEHCNTLTGN